MEDLPGLVGPDSSVGFLNKKRREKKGTFKVNYVTKDFGQ